MHFKKPLHILHSFGTSIKSHFAYVYAKIPAYTETFMCEVDIFAINLHVVNNTAIKRSIMETLVSGNQYFKHAQTPIGD